MWVYRLLYAFWFAGLWLVSPFHSKLRRGLRGRKRLLERVRAQCQDWTERPYWFHFASSGEFEQAIPILDALKTREPACKIFLSYFSPSGQRAVNLEITRRQKAGARLPWDAADFSPLDFRRTVSQFFDIVRPRALIILNREFWPELFEQAYLRNVPVFLFAAYFSLQARRFLPLYRKWLSRLTFLGTTDSSTAEFLRRELRQDKVESLGDPRIERVLERRKWQSTREAIPTGGRNIFIGASLWPLDFEALKPSLAYLAAKPDWTLYLVPHEPDDLFLKSMEFWLREQGLVSQRWSQRKDPPASVLLVDEVGWLAELYRHASIAFVGGAFHSKVHNVLEPAAYAVPILTGPHIQNSFEATEMALRATGLYAARDARDLLGLVEQWESNPRFRQSQGKLALQFIVERSGAGVRYSRCLQTHLNPTLSPSI